jgi:hypothetical protein
VREVATWQHTLGSRAQDAIAAYYARYPDATAGEIAAWLGDRGFEAEASDIEGCMAALDSHRDWRTGWINRNIHLYSPDFDPDVYLAMRGHDEDDGWQVVKDEFDEAESEEYEDGEWEEAGQGEDDERYGEAVAVGAPALARTLGGEDRLPGIALAVAGLAASAGVIALIVVAIR